MKLNNTDKRIVCAALTYAVEGDDVLWDDLSDEDQVRAQELLGLLDIELSEVEDDEEEDEEDWEDEEDEEEDADE